MPRKKGYGSVRRKFYGNKFTKQNKEPVSCSSESTENVSVPSSASKRKLSYLKEETSANPHSEICEHNNSGFILIELSRLSDLVKSFVRCKFCNSDNSIEIFENTSGRKGLASKIVFMCSVCASESSGYSSGLNNKRCYNINTRLVYAMRCIGKGFQAAETFCAIMDLPPPPRFDRHNKLLGGSLKEVSSISMQNAAKEAIELNDGNVNIPASFDGSWQKRGHTSLNGIVSAMSVDSGKVIDIECMTKFCSSCKTGNNHVCVINFSGFSGGMESQGVLEIFNRSWQNYGVRYTRYLGDGDSKSFNTVCAAQPYGKDVTIDKLECVGHVQKRMGSRLRKLKKDQKGKILPDGKNLAGRGRLTDKEIDLLQNYYGLAIRRNQGNVEAMKKAVLASLFHKASTDDEPNHYLCPSGIDSWCGYQRAEAQDKSYKHKNSLPYEVIEAIKPIYNDLSNRRLLEKCLHGKTQNVNECFNRCIWDRLPKTTFVGLNTLKTGVMDAVICFNEGAASRIKVFELLGMTAGDNMKNGLTAIDKRRVADAERMFTQSSKEARISKRNKKRKLEDSEALTQHEYEAGGF